MNGEPDGLHTDDVGVLPDRPARHARDSLARLELGSGYSPTPGFVHLDANPNTHPDILGSAYPLPPEVVERGRWWDEIRAVDVLEHITYRDAHDAVREWARVLRNPGGRIYVQVPDADSIMREYARKADARETWNDDEFSKVMPIVGAEWRLLGGHQDGNYVHADDDWRWNAHYSLWTPERLELAFDLCSMKMESMEINAHPNICAWFVKP